MLASRVAVVAGLLLLLAPAGRALGDLTPQVEVVKQTARELVPCPAALCQSWVCDEIGCNAFLESHVDRMKDITVRSPELPTAWLSRLLNGGSC